MTSQYFDKGSPPTQVEYLVTDLVISVGCLADWQSHVRKLYIWTQILFSTQTQGCYQYEACRKLSNSNGANRLRNMFRSKHGHIAEQQFVLELIETEVMKLLSLLKFWIEVEIKMHESTEVHNKDMVSTSLKFIR